MDRILRKFDINFDKIVDKFYKYCIDSHGVYYDSIDSYYSGREPTIRRKTKFYLNYLVLVIYNVKCGLLSLYPDKLQWTPLKDFTLIFGKQVQFVHAMFFSLGIVTILGKLIIFYLESRKKLILNDMVVDWKARKPLYQISEKHLNKITLRAFILYYGYIRITGFIIMFMVTLIATRVTITTYLYHNYGNVIILWFWTIIFIINSNQIKNIMLIGTFLFYIPITRLNYIFDELIERLRVSIRWNNEQRIHQVLHSYNELIGVVQQLSGYYNMVIGLVYCIVPYIIALCLELTKIDRHDLLFTLLKRAFLGLFIITNVNAFIINQISASITVRNKSIHKYLYPMFCSNRKTRIHTKLKIDSFIARLNTQFIGFYCFNLFKFTKMAFYQYAFTVSTSYFLIKSFLKY